MEKMDINKLEEYKDVKELAKDVKETLDSLALRLQQQILEKYYPCRYRRGNFECGEKLEDIWKIEGRGIAETISKINRKFGTKYETDFKKLDKYHWKPVQYEQ